jgi:two-component system response regulator AtoC
LARAVQSNAPRERHSGEELVTGRILVVDDDAAVRKVLAALLGQAGHRVFEASSGEEALALVGKEAVDLIIADVRMPGIDGLALLTAVAASAPDLPVVMISGHASIPMAVEAMKRGARDFLEKPFDREEVLVTAERALRAAARHALEPPRLPVASRLVGASQAMDALRADLARAARSTATVLLRGESGTGKEVAAREIHELGARRAAPFVPVHCAALPEALLESELFGYEKGAFTGAAKQKPGRVQLARGGTLFLDEIADVSLAIQVKLLRLLQDREIVPLGGTAPEKVDVRFIAATHRDVDTMMARGELRQDLFFRLNVMPIWVPPLRERPGDVPLLVERFCEDAALRNHVAAPSIRPEALEALGALRWSGNVRELQSCVERLVVFANGGVIGVEDVVRDQERMRPLTTNAAGTLDARVAQAERSAIQEALVRAHGNRTVAARMLGVSRRTLYNKLVELGIG